MLIILIFFPLLCFIASGLENDGGSFFFLFIFSVSIFTKANRLLEAAY